MANFVLKKQESFTFQMEGSDKVYTLPELTELGVDDTLQFNEIATTKDIRSQILACKEFILRHVPEVEELGLGEMAYVQIFTAYAGSQAITGAKAGES